MAGRPQGKQGKTTRVLLIAGIIIAFLILAAIIVIGVRGARADAPANAGQETTIYGDEYLGIDPGVDEALKDYRNLVVFGIDKNDQTDESGQAGKNDQTDENDQAGQANDDFIIISFHKNQDEMKMFSIDGDTYLKIQDNKYGTACDAYNAGGMDQLIKAINQNLDLNIREGLALEWDAVVYLVDAIGGIELAADDGTVQAMMGAEAVDFARTDNNMQTVFMAAFIKAKTMKSSELTPIMDELLAKAVKRGMSRDNVTATLMEMAVYEDRAGSRWPYTASPASLYETDVVIAHTLQSNVSSLHAELFGQESYAPTKLVQKISREMEGKAGQGDTE